MKKLLIMCILPLSLMAAPVFGNDTINININGEYVTTSQPPVIQNGRTLVPLRIIAEKLNCEVKWDVDTKTITIIKDSTEIHLQINNTHVEFINSSGINDIEIETPATIISNTTMVPVRAVSNILNCNVDWDSKTKTVIINSEASNTKDIKAAEPVIENSKEDETTKKEEKSIVANQELRNFNAKFNENSDLVISFLPDAENDYSSGAKSINVAIKNKNGTEVFTEDNFRINFNNNNEYIEYIVKLNQINRNGAASISPFIDAEINVELMLNNEVTASNKYIFNDNPFICAENVPFNSSQGNASIIVNKYNADSMNNLNIDFTITGYCTSPDNYTLDVILKSLDGKIVGTSTINIDMPYGNFDYSGSIKTKAKVVYLTLADASTKKDKEDEKISSGILKICNNCGAENKASNTSCEKCGIVFSGQLNYTEKEINNIQ